MSTLKDVANEADVSIASVSRYLNNNQSVRRETGDKIEAAIKKLDYCIDSAAQSLKTGRFYRIGIISPATGPHYLEIISSIEIPWQIPIIPRISFLPGTPNSGWRRKKCRQR